MASRLLTIIDRFGVTSRKSEEHLEVLLRTLHQYGVRPTLPVTAVTAKRHPEILRRLVDEKVELAGHGYVHNDYASLSRHDQMQQVALARETLNNLGFPVRGWRCPYSRWNGDTLASLNDAGFEYDATPVYAWPAYEAENLAVPRDALADYRRLCELFGVRDAETCSVLPTIVDGLVQIPMSIPQDEDMVDRMHLDAQTMIRVWRYILTATHERSELFVICLHPERASLCAEALDATLSEARGLTSVWIATLGEIADWWRTRNQYEAHVESSGQNSWKISVTGPSQMVTSFKGQTLNGPGCMIITTPKKPVISVRSHCSNEIVQRIHDTGYLVEHVDRRGADYAVTLDPPEKLDMRPDEIAHWVRQRDENLVRIQPWPFGYRSCLNVSGDIDAITLFDFAMRLKEF